MSLKPRYGIYSSKEAYCILNYNGKVVAWGSNNYGGNTTLVDNDISANIVKISPSPQGFHAINSDGKVFAWGMGTSNTGYFCPNFDNNKDFVDIITTAGLTTGNHSSFVGLKSDGTIQTWGYYHHGQVAHQIRNEVNDKYIELYSLLSGFVGLKEDRTCVIWGRHDSYSTTSLFYKQVNIKNNLTNIKKVYTSQDAAAFLTFSGGLIIEGTSTNGDVNSTENGIRGRDGLLGDPVVLTSGVKDVYATKSYFYILKDDGSLHVVGAMKNSSSLAISNDFKIEQYAKLTSGVSFVHVNYDTNKCSCLMDDGSVVSLFLDVNDAKNTDLSANVTKLYYSNAIRSDGSVVAWNGYTTTSVSSQVSSGVVEITVNQGAAAGRKSDGSVVVWPNTTYSNHVRKGSNVSHGSYGVKNYSGSTDATVLNSGIIKVYTNNESFAAVKNDGKVYTWGETNLGGNSTAKQSVLTDISVNYQDINDNYNKYLYFRSHDKCRLNEYVETSTTLNQTSYNSTKYGTSGSLNSKTVFHTNLDTSRYVYMYTDTTGGGILKNNNVPVSLLLNNGITKANMDTILAIDLDNSLTVSAPSGFYGNVIKSNNSAVELRGRRVQLAKTIFKKNFTHSFFNSTKASLNFSTKVNKSNFKVLHALSTNQTKTYDVDTDSDITSTKGFYIVMEKNQKAKINFSDSEYFTIEITEQDNNLNNIYYITHINGEKSLIINETDSDTYVHESYPAGPFKDGDKVVVNFLDLVLDGGVVDARSSTASENYTKNTYTNPTISTTETAYPIFGTTHAGFYGIASNDYLYSWDYQMTNNVKKNFVAKATTTTSNSTTGRLTNIKAIFPGRYFCIALLNNGKVDYTLENETTLQGTKDDGYAPTPLNYSTNIWYNNSGVKQTDLTQVSDIVDVFPLFYDQEQTLKWVFPKFVLLRSNGTLAYWGNDDDIRLIESKTNYTDQSLISETDKNKYSIRGIFGQQLLDPTHPNFSPVIKVVVGIHGFIILRQDGKIAILRRKNTSSYLALSPAWNSSIESTIKLDMEYTLGGTFNAYAKGTAVQYLGKVIDVGVFGNTSTKIGSFYILNSKGQFWTITDGRRPGTTSNIDTNAPAPTLATKAVHFGDSTLSDPTKGLYFKKTIKVYTAMSFPSLLNVISWMTLFDDFSAMTSYSESEKTNSNEFIDILDFPIWKRSNRIVKGIQYTDPFIKKYYGPYVLLQNNTLRLINFMITATNYTTNLNYAELDKYDWNDPTYGIHGTNNGYTAGTEEYGDISNVKEVYIYNKTSILLKNSGEVLTWGDTSNLANTYSIKNTLVNGSKIIINQGGAAALLKNDGSVVVWGNTSKGGSLTDTVPVIANGTTGDLTSGVQDIFSSGNGFTAVKSDGIIFWSNDRHTSTAVDNLSWSKKTVGYSGRYSNVASTIPLQHLNLKDCSIYKTTTELETVCTDLITEGVKEEYVQALKEYPKYSTNFLRLYIPDDFYKGTTKDDVRKLLIDALYLLNPEIQTFLVRTKDFAIDNKINGELVNIIKPNHGIINLNEYLNREVDFYVPMKNSGDKAIFKDVSSNITYKLIYDGTSSYTISKCDGETALYSSSGTTVTGKTVINGTTFNFKHGVMSGRDTIDQTFNCISTTIGAAAYLSTNGKIITWGDDGYGGFSHDEFDQFKPTVGVNLEFSEYPIEGYVKIASSNSGFVALKNDGTVTSWGNYGIPGNKTNNGLITYNHKPDLVDVKEISASYDSVYGALKNDGTLVLWGNSSYAYNIHNKHPLTNIKRIIPNYRSFHAIRNDNSLISFGHQYNSLFNETYGVYGSRNKNVNNFTSHQTKLDNIIEVYSNNHNHIAINSSGVAIFWGNNESNATLDSSIKAHLNTNVFVNVSSTDTCHALLSSTGFVFALGNNNVYQNSTTGQWHSVKTNLQSNCTRIVSSSKNFQVLKSDNKLVGIIGSTDTNNSIDYNQATSVINKPPSDNIESRYVLQNIKDVFSGRFGFCAITTSDEVICWGVKSTSYITDIDTNTIRGGSLSGTEENENRPVVVFNNGLAWCCLKENDTVITWSGTGITKPEWGTDFNHTTYGVNSTMWGGNGNGGAVRNGDGSVTVLKNVKNIIPYGNESTYGGFIAVCQDGSGNEYCVQWGGEIADARATQQFPNNGGRSFRHVVEHLTSHSKIRVGIHDNIADLSWRKSTKENIHEYNYGDGVFTGVETGFGVPNRNVEVIDIDEVTSKILEDISGSGIDPSIVNAASEESNKLSEDVDEEEDLPDEDGNASKVIQLDNFSGRNLNKQRINFTKLLFAANPNRGKIKVNAATLGLRKTTYKSKYILYKMNFGKVTIDIANDKNLNDSNGFYVPMEEGNVATILSKDGNYSYEITKSEEKFSDGTNKFFVKFTQGYLNITRFNSNVFVPGSDPQGPFHENETAFIANTNIEFGSIKETGYDYSFGDPYINPIFGNPTKLPDKMAIYRLLEGKDLFINGEVNLLSDRKQKLMNDWFTNKSGFSPSVFGFVSKGFYYNKFFISSEGHVILCDLEKQIININSDELSYFNIKNKYDIFSNALMSGEKCNKYTITWNHQIYGNVLLEIVIFENPQIDNAIRIDTEYNINNCIGLLVRNYKPNLMELENIKTEKSKKLRKKLRNRKHKFTIRKLKNRNEVWVDVKNKNTF